MKKRLILIFAILAVCATVSAAADMKAVMIDGVALRRTASGADWKPINKDDTLKEGEELRVLENGLLAVSISEHGEWMLKGSATAFAGGLIKHDTPDKTVWLKLEIGHLAVMYDEPDDREHKFKVTTPAGTVVADTGVFSVITDGSGYLTIAAGRGKVCLERKKQESLCADPLSSLTIDVKTGEIEKSGDIRDDIKKLWAVRKWPVGMAGKPELKIIQPQEGKLFSSPNVFVTGYASKGAVVTVNKTEMPVSKDGGFSVPVSLFEGENKIVVEARSVSGETTKITRTVKLDSVPPILTITQPVDNFDMTYSGNCDSHYCYIQIFGLTEPGVVLIINGVDVSRYVEDDGSFFITNFRLRQSERTITVEVEDILGQKNVEVLYIASPTDTDQDGIPDAIDQCILDPSC